MSTIRGIDIIRRWVIQTRLKEQTKQGGVMITLPKKEFVDLNTSITADRLLRSGIDIDQLTTVGQVDNLINQININNMRRSVISQDDSRFQGIMEQLMGKKDNVVDMRGQRIPPGSRIMGGKAVDDDLPPPGSRGGPDDIAEPVQSAEESLKNMIQAENKKNIAAMKQRKMLEEAIEDASPGFANDTKVDAELVAENLAERMGLVYDDLPTKQRLDIYDQAYTGLSKKRFKQRESLEDFVDDAGGVDPDDPRGIDDFIPDPEDMAKGGIARIGLKDGMNRRTFLKFLGGAISLPIIGRFFKPVKGVGKVAKVPMIKTGEVPGKPEWFDSLVNKVILEGDDVSKKFATKDREIVHMKEIDDETVVKVTQDMDEGVVRVDYESPENMYGDPVGLQFKKGIADEGTKGTPADEFQTTESIPIARADGPDDYAIDIDEGGGQSISDLVSDVSKLKQYATGQKPTLKEIVQTKKRKDQTKAISEGDREAETDFVINRQGEPIIDMEPDIDDFARGGLAGMLGE